MAGQVMRLKVDAGYFDMGNPGDNMLLQAVDLDDVPNEAEIYDMLMHNSQEEALYLANYQMSETDHARRALQMSRDTQLKKNRIAQKKFRDRQKAKMEQMQQELMKQKDIINKKSAENEVLKNSISSLQKEHQYFETVSADSDLLDQKYIFQSSASPMPVLSEKTDSHNIYEEPRYSISKTGLFLRRCWSRFAEAIQGLLAEYDVSLCKERRLRATEELRTHLDRGIQLYLRDVLSQRHLLQHFHATANESFGGLATVTKLKWLSAVQSMELQKFQIDQVIALKELFIPQIESKNSEFHARLKDLEFFVRELQRGSSLCLSVDDLDKLNDKTLQVKVCLQEKQECMLQFLVSFFQCDLQPVQMARCITQSYPDYPDVCQIAHVASGIRLQLSKQELQSAL
eukprot:jgi/Picsp_1/3740/NSC_06576-R1_hypothetical protein CHLNCDRAFT_145296 [Chlorella variabilis]